MPEVLTEVNPDDECVLMCPFNLPKGHKVRDHPRLEMSKKQYPDMKQVFEGMERRAERQRLEREVINKAKEWRELRLMQAGTRRTLAELMDALDDLAYFESSQQQIKK